MNVYELINANVIESETKEKLEDLLKSLPREQQIRSVNDPDTNTRETPLLLARRKNLKRIIQILLKMGATPIGFQSIRKEKRDSYPYSIELIWINKAFDPNQKYIISACEDFEHYQKLLEPIFGYAKHNPRAVVNIWFDTAMTPTQALTNTLHAIERYQSKDNAYALLRLRDIRGLNIVSENADIFSEKISIYFRVDILKVIVSLHTIQSGDAPFSVFLDLDVQLIPEDEIFDVKTTRNLFKYGLVLGKWKHKFENHFQIVSHHKPNMHKAMQLILVDLNIARAKNFLAGKFSDLTAYGEPESTSYVRPLSQLIFQSYQDAFVYFCGPEGYGMVSINRGDAYMFERHGLDYFGLYTLRDSLILFPTERGNDTIPTKKITVPPPLGHYD